MLPSFGGTNPGYLAGHKRRKRKEEVPWGLLFLFLLFAGCTLFTRHRSLRAVDPAVDDVAEEVHQPHSVATVHEKAARAARNLRVDSSTFHPTLHSMYQDQPLLPEPSFAALHGGWKLTDAVYDYAAHHPAAEVLSWEAPRLVRFRSFLTPEEVDHMIGMAENHLERSAVLSADDDNERYDNVRTSFGTWPPVDDFMVAINDRIHRLVAIPHGFGEQIYVLNYKLNQRYDA